MSKATLNDNDFGPSFGLGDLCLGNAMDEKTNTSNVGASFLLNDPHIDGKTVLAGANEFVCQQVEVYQILF